jgi:hypothetical protein
MRPFSLRWLIPFALVALLLPACSDDAGDSPGATLASSTTTSDTTTTTAASTTTTTVALQGHGPFEVTSTVVSHETTQDIWVWAPDTEGSWPIVYALHGTGGSGEGLAVTATELASHGNVVFAPDWGSEQDAECSYRYSLSIAEEYGGDPTQPITYIGHSLGASTILMGGLDDAAYGPGGTYDACFEGGARPSLLVPISGCHYEYEGNHFEFQPVTHSDQGVEIVLVVGTEDTVCEPWQSKDATDALLAAGYDARLVEVEGGNHFTVIFHDFVDDEWLILPDDPAGAEVVQTILDAIEAAR